MYFNLQVFGEGNEAKENDKNKQPWVYYKHSSYRLFSLLL